MAVSGQRYYSPSQGRFLGRDPKLEAGGLNLYGFVLNNPPNLWDVLGMKPNDAPQVGAQQDELVQTLEDGTKLWRKWEASPDGYDWVEAGEFVEMPAFEVKDHKPEPAILPQPIYDELVAMAPAMKLAADIGQAFLDNYTILNPANLTAQGLAKLGAKYARKIGNQGQFKGTDALRQENKMARDAAKAAELNKDQARRLHDEISGRGLGYDEILKAAQNIIGGG
jgi:hypothetical protein